MSSATQIGKTDKFAIVATFDVAEGRMEEFLLLLLAHRDRCLEDEPGTLRFGRASRAHRSR